MAMLYPYEQQMPASSIDSKPDIRSLEPIEVDPLDPAFLAFSEVFQKFKQEDVDEDMDGDDDVSLTFRCLSWNL